MGVRDHNSMMDMSNRVRFIPILIGLTIIAIILLIATSLKYVSDRNILKNELEEKNGPYLNEGASLLIDVSARALISIFIDSDGTEYVLVERDPNTRFPIASVTKLMTALVAEDAYGPDEVVTMSDTALSVKGASGSYIAGDAFILREALHALLISSHNEIALAIAEKIGEDVFVERMNAKARALGLTNTSFVNPIGVDPDVGSEEINYSTAEDIYKLLRYVFENRADIFEILEKRSYEVVDITGTRRIPIVTTNKLLGDTNVALSVLGGKTGETPIAKQNLAVVSVAPSRGRVISVVIGSQDSFGDMKKLLSYVKNSFVW